MAKAADTHTFHFKAAKHMIFVEKLAADNKPVPWCINHRKRDMGSAVRFPFTMNLIVRPSKGHYWILCLVLS